MQLKIYKCVILYKTQKNIFKIKIYYYCCYCFHYSIINRILFKENKYFKIITNLHWKNIAFVLPRTKMCVHQWDKIIKFCGSKLLLFVRLCFTSHIMMTTCVCISYKTLYMHVCCIRCIVIWLWSRIFCLLFVLIDVKEVSDEHHWI